MEKRFVYADNAATTRVSKTALDAAMPFLTESFGNPSSIYSLGQKSAKAVLKARQDTAAALGAERAGEIYFTGGGSEADNWAIKGAAELGAAQGRRHIITTNFEHHAVLNTCAYLQKHGFEVTYLPVDENGFVTAAQVEKALREDTCLVTVMYANNEIGTIQPIADIGSLCRSRGVLFHTDAVQAVGHVDINVREQNIDMLSLSGHKLHAPKGIGALYCKKDIILPSLIHGGSQERGRRAGTENVAGIAALGAAITEAVGSMAENNGRVLRLRERLIDSILEIPQSRLNGSRSNRLAGNINVSFKGVEGESLLLTLDMYGVSASSGSACTSGSLDPSHVLKALGLPDAFAYGSLRLTLGDENTDEEVDYITEILPKIVAKLRSMSPYWDKLCKAEGIYDYVKDMEF